MDHFYHFLRWPCMLMKPVTMCAGGGRSSTYFLPNIGTLPGSSLWWCAMTLQRSCTRLATRPSIDLGTAMTSVCQRSATSQRYLWKMQMKRDRVRWQPENNYCIQREGLLPLTCCMSETSWSILLCIIFHITICCKSLIRSVLSSVDPLQR